MDLKAISSPYIYSMRLFVALIVLITEFQSKFMVVVSGKVQIDRKCASVAEDWHGCDIGLC